MKKKIVPLLLLLCFVTISMTACGATVGEVGATVGEVGGNESAVISTEPDAAAEVAEEIERPDGWSDDTHSNDVEPNYDVVFPQDQVNRMTIVIDSGDWQSMIDNMTELHGEPRGEERGGGRGPGGGRPDGGGFDISEILPEGCELPEGFVPGPDADWPEGCEPEFGPDGPPPGLRGERPEGGPRGERPEGGPRGERPEGGPRGGPGGGRGVNLGGGENPDYVAATIEFDGDVWTKVGVRFKGNSTLRRSWNSGSLEMPFKLDFDEFEDEYPEVDNQRFYGFKQLSISPPSADESYVRAATAYNLMQDAGLIAPETAWYELFVDYGEGPLSFGLYTFIEVIDDSVIKTALGDDDGNIYEGDGRGSSLAEGTFEQIPDSFQKENNDEANYSDMEALYHALHAETRLSDSDQWRSDLEAVFDVDTFLHWLAVNSVMVNWDTYGQAPHNFYLYHDPESDLLTWIGWDYNEALQPGRRGNATLSLAETTEEWPLIRYLLDQPAYYEQYTAYVAEVKAGVFNEDRMAAQLSAWETLLAPYVADRATFATQIETIMNFVQGRHGAVETFLSSINN